jgi:hypothetical protein
VDVTSDLSEESRLGNGLFLEAGGGGGLGLGRLLTVEVVLTKGAMDDLLRVYDLRISASLLRISDADAHTKDVWDNSILWLKRRRLSLATI